MRVSLLVSLGLSPLACGGTARSGPDGSAGAVAQGGAGAYAGELPALAGGGSYPTGGYGGSYGGEIAGGARGYLPPQCDSPTFDPVTHLTKCTNGIEHRPAAVACSFSAVDNGQGGAQDIGAGGAPDIGAGGSVSVACQIDADCRALAFGYCDYEPPMPAQCRSGCQTDSDCGTNQLCECAGPGAPGKCLIAGCRVDADCGPNSLCAAVRQPCSSHQFMCTGIQDACTTDADCGAPAYCSSFGSEHRSCSNAVCGRPFLVEACPRLAEIEMRSDWLSADVRPSLMGLSPLQRAELSAHWARLGQMEHASIAAFARFNLQLLSLGAPGELIEACNRALVDETAHTRLCFALASEYGGTALGPARLDIAHCFEDNSLQAIMNLVLREGCLGETVAALEALEAATLATDLAVRSALSRIARDEQTHAELAFKFLAWALTQSSPDARAQLEHEAQRALADFEAEALARPADQRDSLGSDGIIGGEALRAIHLGAVREVVEPLLSAILQQSANANHSVLTQA